MGNPQLNKIQLQQAHKLLRRLRKKINTLAGNDPSIVFAFRRKIFKHLIYDERGTPLARKKLKKIMLGLQKGICPICKKKLPKSGAVLDRFFAPKGYVVENVRLIHPKCDTGMQKKRGYK